MTDYTLPADEIHGDIHLEENLFKFVSTWFPLQRLKSVDQIGLAQRVFSSANHTRFQHSLGTFAVSRRLRQAAIERGVNWDLQLRTGLLELMALVHDVGHGPYSHVAETILKRNPKWCPGGLNHHEDFTKLLIGDPKIWQPLCADLYKDLNMEINSSHIETLLKRVLKEGDIVSEIAADVLQLIDYQRENLSLLEPVHESFGVDQYGLALSGEYALVSGEVDIDRIDYMLRDGRQTGLVSGYVVDKIWEGLGASLIPTRLQYKLPDGSPYSAPGFVFDDTVLDAFELFLIIRQLHFRNIAFTPITRLGELLWVSAAEKKLRAMEKEFDLRAVKVEILRWFTRLGDYQFRAEFAGNAQMEEIEQLARSRNNRDFGGSLQWKRISIPFWSINPKVRILLMDILADRGSNTREPASVLLEKALLRALELSDAAARARAFVDFSVPPVYVPQSLIRISQTDFVPLTFARNRSATLTDLALAPFKDGEIALYVTGDSKRRYDTHDLNEALDSAMNAMVFTPGRLSNLSEKMESYFRNRRQATSAQLTQEDSIMELYSDKVRLLGIKEAETGSHEGLCLELEKDLDRLWACGFLSRKMATFHPDDQSFVWANMSVEYMLNESALEEDANADIERVLEVFTHDLRNRRSKGIWLRERLNKLKIESLGSHVEELTEIVQETIDLLSDLELLSGSTETMLQFLSTGNVELSLKHCSLKTILRNIESVCLPLAHKRNVQLIVDRRRPHQEHELLADCRLLHIAFLELLIAVLNNSRRGTMITVECQDEQNQITIIIALGEATNESAHEKYEPHKRNEFRSESGTGFSVTVASRIIEAHGGVVAYLDQREVPMGLIKELQANSQRIEEGFRIQLPLNPRNFQA